MPGYLPASRGLAVQRSNGQGCTDNPCHGRHPGGYQRYAEVAAASLVSLPRRRSGRCWQRPARDRRPSGWSLLPDSTCEPATVERPIGPCAPRFAIDGGKAEETAVGATAERSERRWFYMNFDRGALLSGFCRLAMSFTARDLLLRAKASGDERLLAIGIPSSWGSSLEVSQGRGYERQCEGHVEMSARVVYSGPSSSGIFAA